MKSFDLQVRTVCGATNVLPDTNMNLSSHEIELVMQQKGNP
jgi:hypothetical protein